MPALLETPPQVPQSFEDLPLVDLEYMRVPIKPPVAERIGGAALDQEVDASYIEEGIALLNAEANANVPTDQSGDGRVHDIEAAHAAALMEEAHTAALEENAIFDAHAAALKEEEEREQAKSNTLKEEAESEDESVEDEASIKPLPDDTLDAPIPQAEARTLATDYRTQAETLLKEAGYSGKLPMETKVRKDFATGNLLVANGNNIKVVKLHSTGGPKVVEYTYDKDDKTLTARTRGLRLAEVHVDEFAPHEVSEGQLIDMVKLPLIAN